MSTEPTYRINHRTMGDLIVKHMLTQTSGMIRVQVTEGEEKNTSFVITPDQFSKLQRVTA